MCRTTNLHLNVYIFLIFGLFFQVTVTHYSTTYPTYIHAPGPWYSSILNVFTNV